MERYREYKDSGVKWLGEIPSHWELRKIFGLFLRTKEKILLFYINMQCNSIMEQ